MDRRDFLKTTGIVALAGAGVAVAGKVIADSGNNSSSEIGALTKHELPKLPYAYDALKPYIDEETMTLHHSKHHQAYVDGLNKAESEISKMRASGDFSLIEYWSKKASFNGGGHALHSLFWSIMAAPSNGPLKGVGGINPEGTLLNKIIEDFGSFDNFKKQFTESAIKVEGSGWTLLSYRKSDKRLIVHQVENQHKLSSFDSTPILGLDVWEHAYYLSYKNKRVDYVNAWWNVVNWSAVSKRFSEV